MRIFKYDWHTLHRKEFITTQDADLILITLLESSFLRFLGEELALVLTNGVAQTI